MRPIVLDSLKEQIEYFPETGKFFWKVDKMPRTRKGDEAGTLKDGYIHICCDQRFYRTHRLAWIFMTGAFPKKGLEVDHINGVRDDNRWSNLRAVTRSQNKMNTGLISANKSGVTGVYFDKSRNKWVARIQIAKKCINLGRFDKFEESIETRKKAEVKYFGEFTRGL